MLQVSDIQSSQEELQEYYAQLEAQHVTPAWIGGGISVEPQSKAVVSRESLPQADAMSFAMLAQAPPAPVAAASLQSCKHTGPVRAVRPAPG